jgi:hypothetical protein
MFFPAAINNLRRTATRATGYVAAIDSRNFHSCVHASTAIITNHGTGLKQRLAFVNRTRNWFIAILEVIIARNRQFRSSWSAIDRDGELSRPSGRLN